MGSTTKAVKKTTVADLEKVVKKLVEDNKALTSRLYESEHVIKSLNIALIGMAYSLKVNPKRINNTNADEFLSFIEKNVHPMIRRSDELTSEVAEKAKQDIAKQSRESQKNEGK